MGRLLRYPEEFRRETVRLVLTTDKSGTKVVRDLGVSDETLGNLVRAEQVKPRPGALSEDERLELKRLRKESSEFKVEQEILRKAAAYFVKETTR